MLTRYVQPIQSSSSTESKLIRAFYIWTVNELFTYENWHISRQFSNDP